MGEAIYGLTFQEFTKANISKVDVPVLQNTGVWLEDSYGNREEKSFTPLPNIGQKKPGKTKPVRQLIILSKNIPSK